MKNKIILLSAMFLCLLGRTGRAQITNNTPVCAGATLALSETTPGGVWSSDNESIATVNPSSGLVTGVSAGTATISYVLGGYSDAAIVTVGAPIVNYISSNRWFRVCAGSQTNGVAVYGPSGGVWSSSNTAVGTIADDGFGSGQPSYHLTGLTEGVTQIRYTKEGCYLAANITVGLPPITGDSFICVGDVAHLETTAAYEIGPKFSADDHDVADFLGHYDSVFSGGGVFTGIHEDGNYTGISAGTTTITYTYYPGCYTTTEVTVNATDAEITGTNTVCVGLTTALSATPAGGTWTSGNVRVATVSTDGIVTGIRVGTAVIVYTLPSTCHSAAFVVHVYATPGAITGDLSVCVGHTTDLDNAIGGGTWTSSNTEAATVNASTGVVTGISAGTTVISYALSSGCYSTAELNVNATPEAITGVLTVCVGQTTDLDNATGGGTWVSSNPSVCSVNSSTGVVTGVAAGTADISYILSTGCSSIAQVTVISSVASITGVAGVCIGLTTTLYSSTEGGTWSSSNTAVGTVNSSGTVRGKASGTTNITYSYGGGCYAVKQVTVSVAPTINTPNTTGFSGSCTAVTAITMNGLNVSPIWSSSNVSVATISSSGVVTIIAEGTTTLTNSKDMVGGCIDTHVLTVTGLPSITGGLKVCENNTITASGIPAGGTWISPAINLSIVKATGVITVGASSGTQTITYTIHGRSQCSMTSVVDVNPTMAAIAGGISVAVGEDTLYTNATSGGTWSTSNASIATINSSTGVLHGVSAGMVTISYIVSGGCFKTTNITIVASKPGHTDDGGYTKQLYSKPAFTITPNPSNGNIIISQARPMEETVNVKVMTYTGVVIYDGKLNFAGGKTDMNISKAPAGMYLVTIINSKGEADMQKIVITK